MNYGIELEFFVKNSQGLRVKGVFAIKSGILGDRVEYRSLPNIVPLDKIIETLI